MSWGRFTWFPSSSGYPAQGKETVPLVREVLPSGRNRALSLSPSRLPYPVSPRTLRAGNDGQDRVCSSQSAGVGGRVCRRLSVRGLWVRLQWVIRPVFFPCPSVSCYDISLFSLRPETWKTGLIRVTRVGGYRVLTRVVCLCCQGDGRFGSIPRRCSVVRFEIYYPVDDLTKVPSGINRWRGEKGVESHRSQEWPGSLTLVDLFQYRSPW